jgi:hypothetical protein
MQFVLTYCFSIIIFTKYLTDPVLAPLPTGKLNLVNCNLLIGITCLLMWSPSISTLFSLSMSPMTASFPSSGP